MTGDVAGIWDASLHALLMSSDAGTAAALRVAGLVLVLLAAPKPTRVGDAAGLCGATLIAASFAFMGHTATHELRWLLAGTLILHVLVAAFWLGALWPLHVVGREEPLHVDAVVVERFSAVALWLVPLLFVAGLILSVVLLPDLAALQSPYGTLLIAKSAGFALLMGFAALNNRRYGPAIAGGDAAAARALGVSVRVEWAVIAAVVVAATVMTSLFSPTLH
ncbi:MAG: CopD family protein [Gammaproteobacteria bacterium]|nr:CopD family protein [Gammaproteobacteria bacterium]